MNKINTEDKIKALFDKYEDKYDISVKGGQSSFRQADRERSLQILMIIFLIVYFPYEYFMKYKNR